MNYQRQYNLLVEKARQRGVVEGYKERHHIIPRCMGGGNGKDNVVELTAREHYVAHRLLYMWHKTPQMAYAWNAMTRGSGIQPRKLKSSDYERTREVFTTLQKTRVFTDVHRSNIRKAIADRSPPSEESRKKMSEAKKGKKKSLETRKRMSEAKKAFYQALRDKTTRTNPEVIVTEL